MTLEAIDVTHDDLVTNGVSVQMKLRRREIRERRYHTMRASTQPTLDMQRLTFPVISTPRPRWWIVQLGLIQIQPRHGASEAGLARLLELEPN